MMSGISLIVEEISQERRMEVFEILRGKEASQQVVLADEASLRLNIDRKLKRS